MADEENKKDENVKEQQKEEGQQGEGTVSAAAKDAKPEPISLPKPPASNPGVDDPSGGMSEDAGGLSCTAYVHSPVPSSEGEKGIVDTVKSFLGFGAEPEKEAADAVAAVSASAAATISVAAAVVSEQTARLADRTKPSDPVSTSEDSTASESKTQADNGAAAASFPSPGTNETESKKDDNANQKATEKSESQSSNKGNNKSLENRDAIPTAGGEKLGEKHWGESKIVPDNPKPSESEGSGVSSKDGQPTDEVASNTAKNAGGASEGGAAGGEEKKSLVDKIKDKMPGGKKD